ncbi:hypothetical protein AB3N04_00505 (plasmid) [Alkalihalophilus sp. As8PL]|uniref:Secreted protein n=1 Tax=Alkalihalophilus sp. As8PL TaxID=3237103 RepID=A0AB39BN72_9BACI
MDHQHEHCHHPDEGHSEIDLNIQLDNQALTIEVKDQDGGVPELDETHEELMHLILISHDLEDYYHVHPIKEEDGVFKNDLDIPEGHYYAFVDINPKDKVYAVEPNELLVGEVEHFHTTRELQPDDEWLQKVDGKEVELEEVTLTAGGPVQLAFDLKGETPEPYLGALGHVVIVDEDVENFIHVHPASNDTTVFEAHFPHEGTYKLWAEFKFSDEGVLAFPFVLKVQ